MRYYPLIIITYCIITQQLQQVDDVTFTFARFLLFSVMRWDYRWNWIGSFGRGSNDPDIGVFSVQTHRLCQRGSKRKNQSSHWRIHKTILPGANSRRLRCYDLEERRRNGACRYSMPIPRNPPSTTIFSKTSRFFFSSKAIANASIAVSVDDFATRE